MSKVSKTRSKMRSKTERAGICFPIGRIRKFLKKGNFAPRVGFGAPLYMAASLEYLAAEILELSVEVAKQNKKLRISPRHVLLAIRNDEELDRMLKGVTISRAGVLPIIQPQLLPKRTAKPKAEESEEE